MEIKGTAVRSIPEYVKQKHPNEYVAWIKSLPEESQKIMSTVTAVGWYPLKEAAIIPSAKVGEMFFNNDTKKGAWELGRFSAEIALHGIYKLYVKFSSPGHIITRASRIFSAYYAPSKIESADQLANSVKLIMTQFDMPSDVIEYRIAGWVERALEISGCKGVDVEVVESFTKGNTRTVFQSKWR